MIIPLKERLWRPQSLLLCYLAGTLLLLSFFWAPTRFCWDQLDIFLFRALNSTLEGHPNWQLFWACANHRLADWVEDVCFLLFFIAHVRSFPTSERSRKIAELLFCVLWIALILFFVNRLLFRETLCIPRPSPTLLLDHPFLLSDHISWMSVKDYSSASFPGDHGTTALLFASVMGYLSTRRLGILAALYALFLCLPRLITGAHWASDIIVGSGSIALICLGTAFCTPLFPYATSKCALLFTRKKKECHQPLV